MKIKLTCPKCNKEFERYPSQIHGKQTFCSRKCSNESLVKNEPNCKCETCGKLFRKQPNQLRKYKSHFCSNDCAAKSRKLLENRPCTECGKDVERKPSEFTENTFCSRDCYHSWFSKQSKNKMEYSCYFCGESFIRQQSQVKGRQYLYCSKICKDKHNGILFGGANSPAYNPNITDEERENRRKYKEYYIWRDEVYKRDNFTCQCCEDNRGGNLVAHHIINFSENKRLRTKLSNGITLCETCHKKFHDQYGYTKNNKEQLIEFLQRYANQLPLILVTR